MVLLVPDHLGNQRPGHGGPHGRHGVAEGVRKVAGVLGSGQNQLGQAQPGHFVEVVALNVREPVGCLNENIIINFMKTT